MYFRETGQVTPTRHVANNIEVSPDAVSTATGARGNPTMASSSNEDCDLDIINCDTNDDCVFDSSTDLESAVKTDSAPLASTRRLRSSTSGTTIIYDRCGIIRSGHYIEVQTTLGFNQAKALRQLALATDFTAWQESYTLTYRIS